MAMFLMIQYLLLHVHKFYVNKVVYELQWWEFYLTISPKDYNCIVCMIADYPQNYQLPKLFSLSCVVLQKKVKLSMSCFQCTYILYTFI